MFYWTPFTKLNASDLEEKLKINEKIWAMSQMVKKKCSNFRGGLARAVVLKSVAIHFFCQAQSSPSLAELR